TTAEYGPQLSTVRTLLCPLSLRKCLGFTNRFFHNSLPAQHNRKLSPCVPPLRPPDDQGAEGGVLESVSLCASPSPLDGLRGLPPSRLADRQRRDGGRVQDGVHAALQAFGHALASRVGSGNSGFAHHLSERNLGRSV